MSGKTKYGYWKVKKNVINDAKKYKRRLDWKMNSPGAYQSAYVNNWINECRAHFKSGFSVEYGYWQNKDVVIKDAKKYATALEWQMKSGAAYQSARKNGWLNECHKYAPRKEAKWKVKDNVINDSKKYKTRFEWRTKSPSGYQSAVKYGWLDECYAPKT